VAERAAQQQQQPELMNQLQWQKGRQKQTHNQAYLAAHAPVQNVLSYNTRQRMQLPSG
jgi:hypothetical protein